MHIFILFLILLYSTFTWSSDDFLVRPLSSHEKVAQLLSRSAKEPDSISICFNYGCQQHQNIRVTLHDIKQVKAIFYQSQSGLMTERQSIADAIAYLENIAGQQSPVHNDRAKNINDKGQGRMDCIDSAVNTTNYLRFIAQLGLLRQHKLVKPVYRSPYMMGQHWSAQIEEIASGERYAVDSWASDNGQRPLIQPVSNWKIRDSEGIETY